MNKISNCIRKTYGTVVFCLSEKIKKYEGSLLAGKNKKYFYVFTITLFSILLATECMFGLSEDVILNLRYLFSALLQAEASIIAIVLIVAIFRLETISHNINVDSNVIWDCLGRENKILKEVLNSNIPLSKIVQNTEVINELLDNVKTQESEKYSVVDRHVQSVKFYIDLSKSYKKSFIKLFSNFIIYISACVIALTCVPAISSSLSYKAISLMFMSFAIIGFATMLLEILIFTKKSILIDPTYM